MTVDQVKSAKKTSWQVPLLPLNCCDLNDKVTTQVTFVSF